MQGHDKAYYIVERSFSLPELKILIDAVQAASFITESKTENLIQKIAALGNAHRAELLQGGMVCFNSRKHSNEQIYYSVETLEGALRRHQKVSFCYFDLDEKHRKVYRREKQRYIVDPVALVYNEDNYYLMCFSAKHNDIVNYRVDRMEHSYLVLITINRQTNSDVFPSSLLGAITAIREECIKLYLKHEVNRNANT